MTTLAETPDSNEIYTQGAIKYLDMSLRPSPTEVDWAHEHLAGLPVVRSVFDGFTAELWQDGNGGWFRSAGNVTVTWEEGSKQRFSINLRSGAIQADLDWFELIVDRARRGHFGPEHGWLPSTQGDRWTFRWSHKSDEPNVDSEALVECQEPWCSDDVHERSFQLHTAEKMVGSKWTVTVERFDTHAKWSLDILLAEESLSVIEAASFASDIQWAAASARKLNEALA